MNKQIKVKKLREEFGLTVRRKRHKLNFSQEKFAERVPIHRTYISSVELGKVDIGLGVAYKIAAALNIPLSKLIKETEASLKD